MRSYLVTENHIGSAVSEILRYRQTQFLLLLYKNYFDYEFVGPYERQEWYSVVN